MPEDDPYRLPRTVLPERYELELVVDPDAATFSGSVAIDVAVTEPVDRIVLNSLELMIGPVTVTDDGGRPTGSHVATDSESERVELHLDRLLPTGRARVEIGFTGAYCEDLVGLYRSTFTTDGVDHHLAVTQFESTHARRAFPCFDEPDMKAVFAITLVVPDGLLAVSNAAETARESAGEGMVRVRFADTMVMSTYLVAAVVGPLSVGGARSVEGLDSEIPLRVICPPGSERLSSFALDVADAGIRFLERYYDLPYPGDKVDLVAIPDFAFGAMENLGCITFRGIALLVDPTEVTQPELQRVADVINHELAHMWFGDLVTMGWWDGIWLNEAFATFMEVTASDAFRPRWDTWTAFGSSRSAAFDTDALRSTRPIEFPVRSPADAEAMFDVLTYEKGASVLRMLERYLGPDRFRDGIRSYLRSHMHANTETTDLWNSLELSTGEPIRRIMQAWIEQGGHPVVTATPTLSGVELAQVPATITPVDSHTGDSHTGDSQPADGPSWPVPLVLTATIDGVGQQHRVLLEGPVVVDLGATPSTLRVNSGGDGFFRSELPASLRAAEAVDPGATALERFVLLDDAWSGLLRGSVTGTEVEDLVRLLSWRETDPTVWRRISQAVRDLRRLRGTAHEDRSARLASDAGDAALARVDHLVSAVDTVDRERWRDLRGILVVLLGVQGHDAGLRSLAHELFRSDPEQARARDGVDSTLMIAALDVVAATGDTDDHALIEHRWRTATNPQDEIRHLHALADTPVPACFDRLLGLTLGEVRSQDAPYVFRRALANTGLGARAWSFLSEHWAEVMDKVPAASAVRMLEGIRTVTDGPLAARIEEFTAEHPTPSGQLVLAQHVERMWITVRAAERARGELDGAGPC